MRLPSQAARLAWLSEHLPELPSTGIIYTLTKRDANRVADWLVKCGIKAFAYYSDVEDPNFENSDTYRRHLEFALERNEMKALVATTALGMGYDKPDLGFVIHFQAPSSIVAYYQQVGRAGRGIGRAVGVLMHGAEDDAILGHFRRSAFPSEDHVQAILHVLEESDGLSTRYLEQKVNVRHGQINQALRFLAASNPAPIVKEGSIWRRTPVPYVMDREHVSRLTHQREAEWAEVQRYVDEPDCLMLFLANALDDPYAETCGKCASCLGYPVVGKAFDRDIDAAMEHMQRSEEPIPPKLQIPSGAFESYGWTSLPAEKRHEAGRVLSRWGEAGWGKAVQQDKQEGRFRGGLASAMAELIQQRWRPQLEPKWVTCVPSFAHPTLVRDFAERVAGHLNIPFLAVVGKIRQNEPQKHQQNRYHQCSNLDGVFAIIEEVRTGPVLLLDDVVDSGWTLAVIAALLREAGCSTVYPAALASSAPGN